MSVGEVSRTCAREPHAGAADAFVEVARSARAAKHQLEREHNRAAAPNSLASLAAAESAGATAADGGGDLRSRKVRCCRRDGACFEALSKQVPLHYYGNPRTRLLAGV